MHYSWGNGSGKSTLASELLPSENLDFLNADEVAKGICPEHIESVKIQAGKIVLEKLDSLLNSGKSFAIETTLAGKNHIKTIHKAKDLGYKVCLIYSYLDNPDFCENRIKVRVLNGGHDIPKEDIVRRFYRSKENFWKIYKNLVDEWNLFYNGTSEYILVAQSVNNGIEIFSENLYNEFIKDF
ncbi:MAG: zeta toxin family protein [Candidatus Gastranaerophilaceae bacterium]